MKKLQTFFLIAAMAVITSCAGSPVSISLPDPLTPSEACNQQLDQITAGKAGESLIRAKIPNPCDAYRVLATLARAGVVWDLYKAGQLAGWTDEVGAKVSAGITYADLNTLLNREIAKFNQVLGGTYLLASDLLVTFDETYVISEKDVAILLAAFAQIKAEATRLAMLTASGLPLRL